jgi:8-oxo-dGTP pyrophosphatase MutT (NUDIX family)
MSIAVTKFRIAVYGILVEQGRFLMTETRVPSGTIFNFPGGGLELGEAPLTGLEREFQEETNTTVGIGQLLFCSQAFHQNPEYPNEQLMHIYYRVHKTASTAVAEAGNADDVMGLKWVTLPELPSLRILPVDLEFINHLTFRSQI